MSQSSVDLADSRIVMAEQSSHDVVNRTLSGGEPSPSDVPASTNDKKPAGGDVGEIQHTATTTTTQDETQANAQQSHGDANFRGSLLGQTEMGKDTGASTTVSLGKVLSESCHSHH